MGQALILRVEQKQWEKLAAKKATMVVRRSRPLKVDPPARVLVCDDEKILGECLVGHFLKTYNAGVFDRRTGISARELDEYAAGGAVYGWNLFDVHAYEKPELLGALGLRQAPTSWKLMEVDEAWPG